MAAHAKFPAAALGLAVVFALDAQAVEGARAYPLSPVDLNVVIALAILSEGNVPENPGSVAQAEDIELTFGSLEYERTLAFADTLTTAFVIQSIGQIDDGDYRLGDALLGAVVGLVGSPALTRANYGDFDPGFSLSVLGKISLPTGDYDSADAVNMGSDRWSFQIGLPIVHYLGRSLLDRNLMTFELMPSVTWFTDNTDPHDADTLEQAPLFQFEGHVTANLTQRFWVSADAQFITGSETTTDGIDDDNAQRAVVLGFTIDIALGSRSALKFGFEQTAERNEAGPDIRDFFMLFGVAF